MNIEIATPEGISTKEKGDLLENLSTELLQAQNYKVAQELRVIGAELDLLCRNKVTNKEIYVECKAHRNPLSAGVLRQLLGTITAYNYQEGWLITTGPLSKDAKGFQDDWEKNPIEKAQQLAIYTAERTVDALIDAKIIKKYPEEKAVDLLKDEDLFGSWLLLITPYGKHWALTCLAGGVPEGVLIFSAVTGKLVNDHKLLENISNTDTSISSLDFDYVYKVDKKVDNRQHEKVIEVQSGDRWNDYRPARPQDFVGRENSQKRILHFFDDVRLKKTKTRVFAITGDSGMGKSSLIAKIRERVTNQRYRKSFFVYAVDIRAATSSSYIHSALLEALQKAANEGFGVAPNEPLKVSNIAEPLESPSVKEYLESLEKENQVVCLIFDQFEELYSKSDLFDIFELAKRLFISITSAQSNLVLGFAWKSDSTVHQSHPAYFMWHSLADHRLELTLNRFVHKEASAAITNFEKELGKKIQPTLKRQLLENSQGYPWLLKKLCIHLYEQIEMGMSQSELFDKALDIKLLFDKDLQKLSSEEQICLKYVAENAPASTYETLDFSGQDVLSALIDKRLIVRSGDKLNIYWDIFREYVVSEKVPYIPLTYLANQSPNTVLMLATQLSKDEFVSYKELSQKLNINERTVDNVVRNLIMFGAAIGGQSQAKLSEQVASAKTEDVLERLRFTLGHHALMTELRKREKGVVLSKEDMVRILKGINPVAQHEKRTWDVYSDRMCKWLDTVGYLTPDKDGWKFEDVGKIDESATKISVGYYNKEHFFIGDSSPAYALQALEWLLERLKREEPVTSWSEFQEYNLRNAAQSIRNLGMIAKIKGEYIITDEYKKYLSALEMLWVAASNDETLKRSKRFLKEHPSKSGTDLGRYLNEDFERNWAEASIQRIGNSLRQWVQWLILGENSGDIPAALGARYRDDSDKQTSFFDLYN